MKWRLLVANRRFSKMLVAAPEHGARYYLDLAADVEVSEEQDTHTLPVPECLTAANWLSDPQAQTLRWEPEVAGREGGQREALRAFRSALSVLNGFGCVWVVFRERGGLLWSHDCVARGRLRTLW